MKDPRLGYGQRKAFTHSKLDSVVSTLERHDVKMRVGLMVDGGSRLRSTDSQVVHYIPVSGERSLMQFSSTIVYEKNTLSP